MGLFHDDRIGRTLFYLCDEKKAAELASTTRLITHHSLSQQLLFQRCYVVIVAVRTRPWAVPLIIGCQGKKFLRTEAHHRLLPIPTDTQKFRAVNKAGIGFSTVVNLPNQSINQHTE